MELVITIERVSKNRIGTVAIEKQIKEIAESCKNRPTAAGVKPSRPASIAEPENRPDGFFYTAEIRLEKTGYRSENAAAKCMEAAKKYVTRAAAARQWNVAGDAADVAQRKVAILNRTNFNPEPITPDVINKFFDGVYERDAHIRMIHRSVLNAKATHFQERNHVLLWGEPAAAKTVLFKRFKDWYESPNPEVERVAMINSTTLSKAGLETWLLEKANDGLLPEILCFDEIEKFNMDNLSCLLAIMDDQGTISRTNARIGKQSAVARSIIWATCNDINKLMAFNNGALFSRFTKELPCVRPSRDLMVEILLKKLEKRREAGLHVNNAWAKVAVDYAFNKMKTNDPRKISAMLDGGDDLLNGNYFRDHEAIQRAVEVAKESGLS